MILRHRKPADDDKQILRLIEAELLPLSRKSHPALQFDSKLTKKRLGQGTTVVAIARTGKVRGFITYYVSGDQLVVDMLAVHRMAQRHGLGSRLMRKAERFGRSKQCRTAMLYVDARNEAGKAFYRHLGYQESRYVEQSKCYLYIKALVPAEATDKQQSGLYLPQPMWNPAAIG